VGGRDGRPALAGWLDGGGGLTDAGRRIHRDIERRTDEIALAPWRALGADDTKALHGRLERLSGQLMSGGGVPVPNPMGLPWPPEPFPS
jgi:hypothetical protein